MAKKKQQKKKSEVATNFSWNDFVGLKIVGVTDEWNILNFKFDNGLELQVNTPNGDDLSVAALVSEMVPSKTSWPIAERIKEETTGDLV